MFIALLRGVNVGGNQKLPNATFKATCENAGFESLRIHLQSGNAVFRSRRGSADRVAVALRNELQKAASLDVAVLVRTAEELHEIIEHNPFADAAKADPGRLLVVFLAAPANAAAKAALEKERAGDESIVFSGRELYAYLPDGAGRSKLAQAFTPRKLGTECTARNWNTVSRLDAIARELAAPTSA